MTAVIATLTLATSTVAGPKPDDPPRACQDARKAIKWYRARYNEHRAVMGATLAPALERHMGCRRVRARAAYWVSAARANRAAAARWVATQYHWQAWLPENWAALGACETGYGRRPGNWTWDSGSHVSAFGITRHNYMVDAHRIGNLSWDETKARLGRLPTPREQYDAAVSHLRTWGDGWTCPGP